MKRILMKPHFKPKFEVFEGYQGERLEKKLNRMMTEKKAIEDIVPGSTAYTLKKEGVRPEYDIRTDKMSIAQAAMDIVSDANRAQKRGALHDERADVKEGAEAELS